VIGGKELSAESGLILAKRLFHVEGAVEGNSRRDPAASRLKATRGETQPQ
jgi:hypothetical protein